MSHRKKRLHPSISQADWVKPEGVRETYQWSETVQIPIEVHVRFHSSLAQIHVPSWLW